MPKAETSVPLPAEASVGRAEELEFVLDTMDRLEKGAAAALIVTGDSGLGKSHLLWLAGRRLAQAGAVVLSGVCLDVEDAPLGPLRQALRRLNAEPGSARALAAAELRALLDGRIAAGAGDLLERASAGLAQLAEGRPLVLILDDVHLVDRTTGRLLRYLLAGLGGMRLLLLCGVRLDAVGGDRTVREMLSDLRRLPSVQVRPLRPLSRRDTERLATMVAARRLTRAEAARLWDRSGGNPFLVEALARALREGGPDLPETIRDIINERLDTLPQDALTVALAVAAGIEPVDHTLLGEVVPFGEVRLVHAIRIAMRYRVLDITAHGYVFQLGLYREELQAWHLPSERVRLHRAFAEALSRAEGEPQYARLAHHWRHAGEPRLALPAAIQAAQEAERRYGYPEALTYWTLALEITDSDPRLSDVDWIELARAAADAAHLGGENERCLELLDDIAVRLGEPLPVWLHMSRASALTALSRLLDAEFAYRQALDAPQAPLPERVHAAARSAELLLQLGQYAQAGARARTTLELARHLPGMTSAEVLASTTLGFSQAFLDDAAAGRATVEAAVAAAERAGTPNDVAVAYRDLARLLTEPLNELEEGIETARRGARRAAEHGLGRTHGASLLALAANGLFRVGRWREGEAVVAEAMRYSPSGTEVIDLLLARCKLYLGLGDLNGAERDLDALEILTFGGGPQHVLALRTLRSGLAMWRGRYAEARTAVEQGLASSGDLTDNVVVVATLIWHGLRAEAEARTKGGSGVDRETVRRLCSRLDQVIEAGSRRAGPVRDALDGYAALCRGELSRIDHRPDPATWARAVALWEDLKHPYPATYARLRHADALFFRRVDSAKGHRMLRTAYQRATVLEARPLSREIQELAARHRVALAGPQPRRSARSGAAVARPDVLSALTDREYEVLALVAQWLTNKEIAERLYIAERTVSAHVRSILAKLDVPRRTHAADIFLRARDESDRRPADAVNGPET